MRVCCSSDSGLSATVRLLLMLAVVLGGGTPLAAEAAGRECGDDAGPNQSRVPCACGDTVVTTTGLRETDPVVTETCSRHGLRIGADNILLTCRFRSIIGSGSTDTYGIEMFGRHGVTVQKCRIENFGRGIVAENSTDIAIKDNSLRDLVGAAIELGTISRVNPQGTGTAGTRVARNSIKRAYFGIRDLYGANNTIERNFVLDVQYGIYLGSETSLVTDNYMKQAEFGISVVQFSDGSVIEDNAVRDSDTGISTVKTSNVQILDNSIKRSRFGIHLFHETDGLDVEGNRAYDNRIGIRVQGSVSRVRLADNRVKRSTLSGIVVQDGLDNFSGIPTELTFIGNRSEDNGRYGFEDYVTGQGNGHGEDFEFLDNDCDDNARGASRPEGLCQ